MRPAPRPRWRAEGRATLLTPKGDRATHSAADVSIVQPSPYDRRLLVWTALAFYAAVSMGYILFEAPGLGLEHFYYIAIGLIAVATGPVVGALGGLFATLLYAVAIVGSVNTSANVLTASTGIRCLTYVATGLLIGWFARSNTGLVAQMRELAEHDSLTGLLNWRSFEAALDRRCAQPRRFVLLLGDLDDLKQVNDRHGHAEGNSMLRRVADVMAEQLRADDHVARIGGDEFAVLASVADETDAVSVCRRVESALDERGLNVSFGWAFYPADADAASILFRRADERLYESKLERKSPQNVTQLRPRADLAG